MSVGSRNGKNGSSLKLVIVDDEPLALEYLRLTLTRIGGVEVAAACRDAAECLREVIRTEPDAVFLDIQLPEESGMEVAQALSRLKKPPLIVFVTGFDDYAVPAFEVAAVDYVMKPFSQERLEETVRRLAARVLENGHNAEADSWSEIGKLAVKDKNGYKLLDPADVCFIQIRNRKTCIQTTSGAYYDHFTIAELAEKLRNHRFFRANEQCLVNLNRVAEVVYYGPGSYELLLSEPEGTFIPLSRSRTKKLREILDF